MSTFSLDLQFFAQKKGGGSAATNCSHKSYNPNNLGVKIFGGQSVKKGSIIIRQRGTKYKEGQGVFLGRDYTIHAQYDGVVKFYQKNIRRQKRTFVSVLPLVKAE
ncbi:MAG: 50S ribosomal protein L27 [Mycoplasmataceae bacterium RV_VA103A]|nr:MAG: 50S ribosomal protein L27 [Mycoplasmataceae bacterium RV_VA103A]